MQEMIPRETYQEIHARMPIACCDIAVLIEGGLLLVKRSISPLRGRWFVPGGRIRKNEPAWQAAGRIVREEVGLEIVDVKRIGVEETFFCDSPFGDPSGTHTINLLYTGRPLSRNVTIDAHHSHYKFVALDDLDDFDPHPYLNRYIELVRRNQE